MLSYAKSATARPGDRLNGFEYGKTQLFEFFVSGVYIAFSITVLSINQVEMANASLHIILYNLPVSENVLKRLVSI